MKTQMKTSTLTLLLLGAVSQLPGTAQTSLSSGHVDIGIAYDAAAWDLHVHKELPPPAEEFAPGDAILEVGADAFQTVPANPAFSFLGTPGDSVWVLPKSENPNLLFLGIGAEELTATDWIGTLTLSLKGVSGPGNFAVWDTDAFGSPLVLMNSGDGLSGADQLGVIPGSHAHYFYGFTAPGTYTISLEASGTHAIDGFTQSGDVAYTFTVVPEPGTIALLAVGALGLLAATRRPRRPARTP